MTGFESKRDAAADKLQEPDMLTIAYQSGFYDGKKAAFAQPGQEPVCDKDPQGCWNVRCQLGKQCKNLAQPAQEPVGTLNISRYKGHLVNHDFDYFGELPDGTYSVYTAPPQRPWVGLTVQERNDCLVQADPCECLAEPEAHQLMVEVEVKLRERNS
jgi:hypothetical protein